MNSAVTRRQTLRTLLGAMSLSTLPRGAEACSRVLWNDNPIKLIGRTLDWDHDFQEAIWVLPAGMQRYGLVPDNPARWSSRYGSIVMSAYDKATAEGFNEKGLAINMLYLEGTLYEQRDPGRAGIAFFQWPQFYLDNFATVNEVIANLERVQIVPTPFGERYPDGLPLHVAVADSSGASAIIEFVEGQPVIHYGRRYQVMTNEPAYDLQLANLLRYKPFGGTIETLPGGVQPEERFVRAAYGLKNLPKTDDVPRAVAYMMSLLNNISVPFGSPYIGVAGTYPTWWRSIIDLNSQAYYVQTTITPNVFWVDRSKLDLSAGAPALRIEIYDPTLMGDVSTQLVDARTPF